MNPFWRFFEPQIALWLLLLPLLLAFGLWRYKEGHKALAQRFKPELLARLFVGRPSPWRRFGLPLLAAALLLLALMRPQGDPERVMAHKKGRDLVILLDLSKSMYAEDLRPNRLERAKGMIRDLVAALEGERIALIGFAGNAKLLSPLTLDYNYFENILEQANPESINRGGTAIGEALRQALQLLFYQEGQQAREILLITDGEDQETDPLGAAQAAQAKGVVVHTLGLGDPAGAQIPTLQGPLTYQGQIVLTKLDQETLKAIAQKTGGVYIPAETKRVDLPDIYQRYLNQAGSELKEEREAWVWQEYFRWALWPAALCLLWALLAETKWTLHRPLKRPK
ncbi:MAG: VWA domain-containing protein [bacterium]|nr:VWA domain-containing protein [bacterium]